MKSEVIEIRLIECNYLRTQKAAVCSPFRATLGSFFFKVACLFVSFLMVLPAGAYAQNDKPDQSDLLAALARLKSLSVYQYETETKALFPNGQKDEIHAQLYVDRPREQICYRTNKQLLVMNKKWIYKADFSNEMVNIFSNTQYEKYKAYLPDRDELFSGKLLWGFIDSAILKRARLLDSERKGDLLTFKLEFPDDFYIQSFVLEYDESKGLPRLIKIRALYSEGSSWDGNTSKTIYETTSKNYQLKVPDSVFDTDRLFKVTGGKIHLLQYKNYKVSSIL